MERSGERNEEGSKTKQLSWETTEEEKVPRFHIIPEVDYSGLFPASLLVCLSQSNLCCRRRTHTCHTVTQALTLFGSCAGMQSLLPQASFLSHCSLFHSAFLACVSFFPLCYEYLCNNTDVTVHRVSDMPRVVFDPSHQSL